MIRRTPTILLALVSLALASQSFSATTYYVDSANGSDTRDGLSADAAWQSLAKANAVEYKPGDELRLAAGSYFRGQLAPKGSGSVAGDIATPIVIDRYGEGPLPIIAGEGKVVAPLYLKNVQGWHIYNLELRNEGPTSEPMRFGLYVLNDQLDTARHFVVKNVTVRNVNGTYPKDWGAGAAIRFAAMSDKDSTEPGRNFDGILIEDCYIKDCSRNGIVINGGALRENWNPSTEVIVRGNLIEGVGGDGILPTSCQAPLVEWNVMRDCPSYGEAGGAAAGMWPWSCDDALFQYNEVVGHKAWIDAQAYDCDYNSNRTVYQYNLSRDNEGGFMLVCSPTPKNKGWLKENAWNRDSVVRFNLSINDGLRREGKDDYKSPIFHITGGATQGTEIYSNFVIIPKKRDPKMDTSLVTFDQWGGEYPVDTLFRDNTFIMLDGQPATVKYGEAKQVTFLNNSFHGNFVKPEDSPRIRWTDNHFASEAPREVSFSGTYEAFKKFTEFLEAKRNPHRDYGVEFVWSGER